MNRARLESDQRWALLALAAIGVVTVAWWALALWPVPGDPEWLTRARAVCFNTGPDGMPDVSGWILLIGQPLGMLMFLLVVWPGPVAGGLSALSSRSSGRVVLLLVAAVLIAGLFGVSLRVGQASALATPPQLADLVPPEDVPRLDRPAAELGLVNQHGETVALADLADRPAIVTFAFGHCADICPMVVRGALIARDQAATAGSGGRSSDASAVPVVVVTLDPWRDTPARLHELAERWEFGPQDHLLSGSVEEVEAVLDAWNVARQRNPATGDIAHPALVYMLDAGGTIAFATVAAGPETLAELIDRI